MFEIIIMSIEIQILGLIPKENNTMKLFNTINNLVIILHITYNNLLLSEHIFRNSSSNIIIIVAIKYYVVLKYICTVHMYVHHRTN